MSVQESRPEHELTPRGPQNRLWLLACLLLAVVQLQWAGYQLGVGNQSIQVAFLHRLHDGAALARDAMVNQTLAQYPSLFYRALARLLDVMEFEHLYLALHFLTGFGLFVGLAALARGMFGSHWAGLVLGLFLVAGHHHALAEQTLYSSGFTHTWAVFPVMIAVLALWYSGRHWWAFALTGLLANAHALEAGQLGIALGVWALANVRQLGGRKLAGLLALMGLCALPAAIMMLRHHQVFDPQWFDLMRVRSAPHSFPSSWWRAGNPDLPRFGLVLALAGLTLSLQPPRRNLGKTLWLSGAVLAMFVAGYLLTELWPNATVIRAQLFRASRFWLVILLAYIAWGCARSWRLAFSSERLCPRWRGLLEAASAAVTAVSLIVEPALVLLPAALVLTVLVALLNRRLLWPQALLACAALLLAVLAWRKIQFVVPALSPEFTWQAVTSWAGPGLVAGALLGVVGALWYLSARRLPVAQAAGVALIAAVVVTWMAAALGPELLRPPAADAAWFDVQAWARAHTPREALFLTPAQTGGFRILSGRAVVGEWRDGTQLYFDAAFAKPWWERMNALQPGMRLAPDKRRLLVRGKSLGQLDDDAVLALARQFQATHIVLPADEPRRLACLYTNAQWAVYLPKLALSSIPAEALLAKQAKFVQTVALPNIEKHRKSDVRLQLIGADGRPVYDAAYQVTQRRSAFHFGVGLTAPALTDSNQLGRVQDLFGYTVLREPSRWDSLEPVAGQRRTEPVAQWLSQCQARGLAVEWSALSAWPPDWAESLDITNRPARFQAHADDLLGRFGSQVAYWQLADQNVWLEPATNVLSQLRAKYPQARIGLSDAGRFWSPYDGARRTNDLCRGLAEARQIGADFVSLHGRQPWGTWAEAATVYEVFDACQKEGLPVHITEFAVPGEGSIEGPVRRGQWDPKLQAEYCRLFYTLAFSHPNVQALNYLELGPQTRVPGIGLLGPDGKPAPAYQALRDLITKQWRTRLKGNLPLDGRVSFRGFHGEYDLALTLKGGKILRTSFSVSPTTPTSLRFVCDPAAGKIEVAK